MVVCSGMLVEDRNPLVAEFLQQASCSTLASFSKSDLVDLAVHFGWKVHGQIPKKAEGLLLRGWWCKLGSWSLNRARILL